jgi:23S rRNA (guanosine2251-2'-O)-methyltransferase
MAAGRGSGRDGGRGSGGGRPSGGAGGGRSSAGGRPSSGGARGSGGRGSGGAKGRSSATGRGPRNPLGQMGPQATAPRRSATTGLGGEQVEGRQAVRELLLANRRDTREIWMASDLDPAPVLDDIRELAAEARVVIKEVGRNKLDAAARTDAPQGVIAFARPLPESSLDDLLRAGVAGSQPFLLLSDGITDPGNLGALLRSAECAGVTGVVCPAPGRAHHPDRDQGGGRIGRAPADGDRRGACPRPSTSSEGAGSGGRPRRAGHPDAVGPRRGRPPGGPGARSRGPGLGRLVRERCDEVVSIPMRGRLSSLNVATAGALACFEVARGRTRA